MNGIAVHPHNTLKHVIDGTDHTAAAALTDCLIIDQNMPSMTGLEVVERLRQGGASLPIIMITATLSAGLR